MTVNRKFVLALARPSLTTTVMVALPVNPGAGCNVRLRCVPLPPKRRFASGTRFVFEEPPVRLRLSAGV